VARRLALIEKNTCISNWRHVVPTKQNPADLVSRETTPAALVRSEIWLTGPEFLKDDPRNWPDPGVVCCDVDPTVFEKSSNSFAFAVVDEEDCIEQLIARFLCLRKLKIAVAWLRRFIVFLCRRRMPNLELKKESISIEELTAAEIAVVRYVQRQSFGRWMIELTGGGQPLKLRNESSPVMKLDPILVNNVLHVGGRLDKAPLSYEARHPTILPHVSYLTELVIRYFHERVGHFGVNHTLNAICQRYWIIKAVVAVRRMISKCVSCRRRNS